MIQWLRKMATEDIASIAPRQEVVDEFVRYGDEIMKTLVWTGNCKFFLKAIASCLPALLRLPSTSFEYSDPLMTSSISEFST
jgi:hypothetical protein